MLDSNLFIEVLGRIYYEAFGWICGPSPLQLPAGKAGAPAVIFFPEIRSKCLRILYFQLSPNLNHVQLVSHIELTIILPMTYPNGFRSQKKITGGLFPEVASIEQWAPSSSASLNFETILMRHVDPHQA